jgi:protein-disulfide isomerase
VLVTPIEVTADEISAYYQENLDRWKNWKGTMDELRERVRVYLEQQKKYQIMMSAAKSLEPKYGVVVFLKEPTLKVSKVDIEGSYSTGPKDAPVTIVEFSDYQCPACRSGHPVVSQVREIYKGKLRWVFKDFPLRMHKEAAAAAEAARCAGEQSKFWEYQDVLYASPEELSNQTFEKLAQDLGMNTIAFKECIESGKYKPLVDKDIAEAKRVGVDRTPSFVINGRLSTGAPGLDKFKRLIDEELNGAKGMKSAGRF